MSIHLHDRYSIVCRVLRQLILMVAILGLSGSAAMAADEPLHAVEGASHAEPHPKGLTLRALPLSDGSPYSPTSSMIVTWVVALAIIIFAQFATRKMKDVPEGAQNFWELLVETLYNFLENIVGKHLVKKTFWFFATVFIFILFTNWAALIPGVGTIGWGHPNEHGALSHISHPIFRGTNADLNMTLAMAMVFFVSWIVWAIQANGIGGSIVHVFGNPARKEMSGFLKIAMALVFVMVGVLEVVSILFRPVSLSFRLYGNVFAGENVLESMAHIVPGLAWLIPIPFYFLELLVGVVQALVFMLLTAVFTLLICSHGDEHSEARH